MIFGLNFEVFGFLLSALSLGLFVYYVWRVKFRVVFRAEFYSPVAEFSDEVKSRIALFPKLTPKERRVRAGGRTFLFVGKREFKPSDDFVRFGGKTFPVDLTKIAVRDGRKTVLCFNMDGGVLQFGGEYQGGDVAFFDAVLSHGVLQRFIRGVSGLDMFTVVLLVLMVGLFVVGLVLGIFMSPYVLGSSGGGVPVQG